mmetsp:Transcript_107184/g.228886  ORF Transcript_107184/g.228886 Transcript_107184/m.228886 type:complete len:209 (-) Transcript_107184:379-1005(-)
MQAREVCGEAHGVAGRRRPHDNGDGNGDWLSCTWDLGVPALTSEITGSAPPTNGSVGAVPTRSTAIAFMLPAMRTTLLLPIRRARGTTPQRAHKGPQKLRRSKTTGKHSVPRSTAPCTKISARSETMASAASATFNIHGTPLLPSSLRGAPALCGSMCSRCQSAGVSVSMSTPGDGTVLGVGAVKNFSATVAVATVAESNPLFRASNV